MVSRSILVDPQPVTIGVANPALLQGDWIFAGNHITKPCDTPSICTG